MPTATVDDVKDPISTGLDDPEIASALEEATDLNQEYNDESNQSTRQTRKIEKWAAILYIRQFKERSVSEDSVGGASSVFEGDELATARAQLRSWLNRAGGDTAMLAAFDTVRRDSSRTVGSSPQSDDTQSDAANDVTST